jgi:tetratricopeptide (TPR) repeat protein
VDESNIECGTDAPSSSGQGTIEAFTQDREKMSDRIVQLMKLLETDPEDPFCLYSLAFEHQKVGNLGAAVEFYERALAADADYFYAYYHKAKALEEMGDVAGAKATLELGLRRARASGDEKARSEIAEFLDTLT